MIIKSIGIGVGVLVCAAMYFIKQSRSRQMLSTTEWVQLMRENDVRFKDAKDRKLIKGRSEDAQV
jgi:hypothetical protein